MRKNNRPGPQSENLLREMFNENRRMVQGLRSIDAGLQARNINYTRKPPMRNNPPSMRPFRPPVSQMSAKPSGFNDQGFDFGERNRLSAEYPKTNQSAGFFQNQRGGTRNNTRGGARRTPYDAPAPAQQSSASRGWTDGSPQSMTISYKDDGGSGPPRSVWKSDSLSRNAPPASSASSSPGMKSLSNFLSPSSWFPSSGKSFETSFSKNQPQSKPPARIGNSFDRDSFSNRDWNGTSNASKWAAPSNTPRQMDNQDYYDDYYPEPPMKQTATPSTSNAKLDETEFYAKVCDVVIEKVLQHLCPDKFQGTQNSPAESYPPQGYSNRNCRAESPPGANGYSRYSPYSNSIRDAPFEDEFLQRPTRPEYNSTRFNGPREEFAPKPSFMNGPPRKEFAPKASFTQSTRGRGASKVPKRRFAKKRGGLA